MKELVEKREMVFDLEGKKKDYLESEHGFVFFFFFFFFSHGPPK